MPAASDQGHMTLPVRFCKFHLDDGDKGTEVWARWAILPGAELSPSPLTFQRAASTRLTKELVTSLLCPGGEEPRRLGNHIYEVQLKDVGVETWK